MHSETKHQLHDEIAEGLDNKTDFPILFSMKLPKSVLATIANIAVQVIELYQLGENNVQ